MGTDVTEAGIKGSMHALFLCISANSFSVVTVSGSLCDLSNKTPGSQLSGSIATELLTPHLLRHQSEYRRGRAAWPCEWEIVCTGGGSAARERHCSVVVYVSFSSCVGRTSFLTPLLLWGKNQNKGVPMPRNRLYICRLQLCYDHTLTECYWT